VADQSDEIDKALAPLRQRDPAAFVELVERHQPIVMGLCQAMGLRGADLDDAAAEVFANVFRALPRFEGRSELGTWVYRIACRTIPKVRAQYGTKYRTKADAAQQPEQADSHHATPFQQTETADTNRRIWDAVAQLDKREAMAIEMYYRREWPIERVAEVMECPQGTIKTLLFRARQKLKAKLSRQEIGT
jgi:RNA polymerase sigma-70 factor (ECF subfamily)